MRRNDGRRLILRIGRLLAAAERLQVELGQLLGTDSEGAA
jgi:hypothetical protein